MGTLGDRDRLPGRKLDLDAGLIAFLAVAIAVVVTPGPDMLLVMRNTLLGGRSVGAATVLGVITGVVGWATVAVVGLSAVLAASATAFTILRLVGAAYLVWLGVTAWRAAGHDVELAAGAPRSAPTRRRAATQGFLSAALNPKLGVFFLTLLPQFTDASASPVRSLELALLFAGIGLGWLLLFAAFVGALAVRLSSPGVRTALRRISGTLLVGLGVRVALDRG